MVVYFAAGEQRQSDNGKFSNNNNNNNNRISMFNSSSCSRRKFLKILFAAKLIKKIEWIGVSYGHRHTGADIMRQER